MQKIILFLILVTTIGMTHLSVTACMCPGVNPEVYPPDITKSRIYYRDEFKGAAFSGKVLSSKIAVGMMRLGEEVQELTVEVDRFWFGVKKQTVTVYAPKDNEGCWFPFRQNESYFFIPTLENGILYIGGCTYATYNRKPDGNYVDFMIAMFGSGKRFKK
ncbi:MAG: hypothetical protein ABJB40_10165 [Acidobacteriota bacterium]